MENKKNSENTILIIFAIILAILLWFYVRSLGSNESFYYTTNNFSINRNYDNIFSTVQSKIQVIGYY